VREITSCEKSFDADTDQPTIYIGSANLSANSTNHNDENLVEITGGPALAQTYLAEFMRILRTPPPVAQTKAVMENLQILLKGLEIGFEHIVMSRIYLTRFKEDYAAMNETYRSYFPPDRLPARTCVGVTGLAYDALIEIDLVCRRR
jgi:enamine deaminase RidA (YjgF/YER057c/UK114 family)